MSLDTAANLASILTAIAAVAAWGYFYCSRWQRQRQLERYLKDVKESASSSEVGRRTIMHVSGKLKMTEAQVLEAAFSSANIHCSLGRDRVTNRADCLYLEYAPFDEIGGSSDGL